VGGVGQQREAARPEPDRGFYQEESRGQSEDAE